MLVDPPQRLGRRGAVLLILGIIWVMQGVAIPVAGDPPTPQDAWLLHTEIPVVLRVALWVATGAVAIVGATVQRPRWERWGYMALVLMPLERALSYLWSYIVFAVSWGDIGYGRGWVGASIWAASFVLIVTIAGWREVPAGAKPGGQ